MFANWADGESCADLVEWVAEVAPYQPGQFYLRELPCLLAVLNRVSTPLDAIVIDGYVWLDDEQTSGLGAHLYRALGETIPIVGVAKSRYSLAVGAVSVTRGESRRPLFVTAVGMDLDEAATRIVQMHGEYRLPTLLKRVDQLCRQPESVVQEEE